MPVSHGEGRGEIHQRRGTCKGCDLISKVKRVKAQQPKKMLPQQREVYDMLGDYLTKLVGDPNNWGRLS